MSKIVSVFGNGKLPETDPQYQKAYQLGKLLGQNGWGICNGGYGGVMEASAKGARESGAKTVGITLKNSGGWANPWIQEERACEAWRDRLFSLIEAGDAYVIFDGATGTLVELFVTWEMANRKLIQKPIVLMGSDVKKWTLELKEKPFFIFNEFLHMAETAEEAVRLILK